MPAIKEKPLNASGVSYSKVKAYLDNLRESGVTNMFGAGQFLMDEFDFSRDEARAELSRWMKNFGK